MNFLDKKVEEILKNHPSGEDFFNHLDDMIRGHKSIIDAAWDKLVQWCYDEHLWVNRGIPTSVRIKPFQPNVGMPLFIHKCSS